MNGCRTPKDLTLDKVVEPKSITRIHLDLLGGISGDMFQAAFLDLWPDLTDKLNKDLDDAGFGEKFKIVAEPYNDHCLTGSKVDVICTTIHNAEPSKWGIIRSLIESSKLSKSIKIIAVDIFYKLAVAESKVHGIDKEEITFHEVGAWDSIADIIVAAWLIEKFSHVTWTASPLPLGSGIVNTQHGNLMIPTPAVTQLLRGFTILDDGIIGERITPTGAAIISYLQPKQIPHQKIEVLCGTGIGFGTNTFPKISNVLRIIFFSERNIEHLLETDEIAEFTFTVDDQTPEDLSVGLESIRNTEGVLEVSQNSVYGKKGRIAFNICVLARAENKDSVIDLCFKETTTLGIRWQMIQRALVPRQIKFIDDTNIQVKVAKRPNGETTAKAEMEDIKIFGNQENRKNIRESTEIQFRKLHPKGQLK
ncbi:MAG: hypothetical protein CL567_02105 [Alphaproteobacteria bacterium]|nr:hypothetical protein [Alphaproteobacteria bacterium]